jgi:hypothetical protein
MIHENESVVNIFRQQINDFFFKVEKVALLKMSNDVSVLQNTQALLIFDAKPFTPYSEDCLCENLKT